jgi:hypothetical protein
LKAEIAAMWQFELTVRVTSGGTSVIIGAICVLNEFTTQLSALASLREIFLLARQAAIRLRRTQRFPSLLIGRMSQHEQLQLKLATPWPTSTESAWRIS